MTPSELDLQRQQYCAGFLAAYRAVSAPDEEQHRRLLTRFLEEGVNVGNFDIIELIGKQRDVYHTPSLLVTHRLQDAFTLCTHRFDPAAGQMVPFPRGGTDARTTFLMLSEGRLIFDGSLRELLHTENPFVREFLA